MPPQNKENKRRGKKPNSDVDDEEYRRKRDKNNLVSCLAKYLHTAQALCLILRREEFRLTCTF